MTCKIGFYIDIDKDRYDKFIDVLEELKRAEKLYPKWPENKFEQLAIITEELGELAQSSLDYKNKECGYNKVYEEAIQVAAMGLRFLYNLEE